MRTTVPSRQSIEAALTVVATHLRGARERDEWAVIAVLEPQMNRLLDQLSTRLHLEGPST